MPSLSAAVTASCCSAVLGRSRHRTGAVATAGPSNVRASLFCPHCFPLFFALNLLRWSRSAPPGALAATQPHVLLSVGGCRTSEMGLTTAVLQLLVIGLIAGGGTFFMRYHVATLLRADLSASEYFEDSKAGNGTRYRVVTSTADSGGSSCTLEVLTRATAPAYLAGYPGSGPEHSHRHSEQVVVRSGKLGWRRQRGREHDEGVVAAGDAPLEFPAGTSHMLFNADNTTDVLIELTHEPAGPMGEAFFENLAALGWAYGSVDRIHPLQVVVLFDAAAAQLTDVSGIMAPIVEHVVLPLAKFVGFRSEYAGHKSKHGSSSSVPQQQTCVVAGSDGSHDEL